MHETPLRLLLADDDLDDCQFFKEALEDIPSPTSLTTVNDGVELMQLLSTHSDHLPDALFLDLNMPRMNGLECLTEIKGDEKLKKLPVIIFSTSFNADMMKTLEERGAQHYIRKPAEFFNLRKVLLKAFTYIGAEHDLPLPDSFVISPA